MFDEIDKEREKQEKKVEKNDKIIQTSNGNFDNMFEVENITNKEIGNKIKIFSKIFLKIEMCFLAFLTLVMFVGICVSSRELGEGIFLTLLFVAFIIFISFVLAYYLFLIVSGFGALIEDVNYIKENMKKEEIESTKKASSRARNVKSKSKILQENSQKK